MAATRTLRMRESAHVAPAQPADEAGLAVIKRGVTSGADARKDELIGGVHEAGPPAAPRGCHGLPDAESSRALRSAAHITSTSGSDPNH